MKIFGSFSFKKSAFPWGLLVAFIQFIGFSQLKIRYPSLGLDWSEIRGVLAFFSISITGLTASISAFLALVSEEDEPHWISMISDGFRLAFVYGAPTVISIGALGIFSVVQGGAQVAVDAGAAIIQSIVSGILFAVLFHFFRKIVYVTAKANRFSMLAMAFPLLFAWLTGQSLFRIVHKANSLSPSSATRESKLSIQNLRSPAPGVYEDFNSPPWVVIDDKQGGYFVGGHFTSYAGHPVSSVVRINNKGTLDRSFLPNFAGEKVVDLSLSAQGDIYGIARDANNKLSSIFKITPRGTLDSNFSNNAKAVIVGGVGESVSAMPDGRVVLSGSFIFGKTTELMCLLPDGRPDMSFLSAIEKVGEGPFLSATALRSGEILACTWRGLHLIKSDGSLDPRKFSAMFHINGFSLSPEEDQVIVWKNDLSGYNKKGVEIQRISIGGWGFPPLQTPKLETLAYAVPGNGGEIYVVSSTTFSPNALLRLTPIGALDLSFRPNIDTNAQIHGQVNAVLAQKEGVVLAGELRVGPVGTGGRVARLIRLKADGRIDPSFWPTWQ